jgi:hypothetical protein
LAIRPEAAINIGSGALSGLVQKAVYQGTRFAYQILIGEQQLELSLDARCVLSPGDNLRFDLDPNLMWMVADEPCVQTVTASEDASEAEGRAKAAARSETEGRAI